MAARPSLVQVVAPCAMEGGYTFMASYGENSFPVVVPPGGVIEGQTFMVSFPKSGASLATEMTPFLLHNGMVAEAADLGRWKDDLFDCFRLGLCHPSLCNSFFCPQLLMAQVLTRMKLNGWGDRAPDPEYKSTFSNMLIVVAMYFGSTLLLSPPSPILALDERGHFVRLPPASGDDISAVRHFLNELLSIAFGLYTLVVLTKLRRMVRLRYEIPVRFSYLGPYEDCWLACWCGCCVVSQLARQTCEYEKQIAACCSPTGLGATSFPETVLTV